MADRPATTHHREAGGDHHLALPAGQQLGAWRLERTLSVGPFGVTYLALDPAANRKVVIKEYLPADIVTRDKAALRGRTAEEVDLLRRGRDRFLSDGKRLQRVKHPSIVRVLDVFDANNTGYLVFEHEGGETLAGTLAGSNTLSDEPILRRFALALLEALDAVHAAAFLHGKIEPSNIRLRADGTPVLLDFGTARAAASLERHGARIPLTPGYAAIEQYTSNEAQGPWTDLYGLSAVLYRIVAGRDPLDAPARLLEDRLVPASDTGSGRFSRSFLKAIDAALAVRPEDRPQTVAEWRPMLDRPLAPQALTASREPNTADDDEDDYVPDFGTPAGDRSRTPVYVAAGLAGAVVLGTLALAGIGYFSDRTDVRRNAAGGVLGPLDRYANDSRGNPAILPLPIGPSDEDIVRQAREREQQQRQQADVAAAASRAAEEQRARDTARQEQERQQQQARQAEEQRRRDQAAQQEQARQEQARQEQTRQAQLRQEQARQEQERQAAARAAEEARQRDAAARQEAARQEQARQEQARQEAARQEQLRQKQERQAAATRLAEEIRQRDLARQQEQITAARTLEEARAREQTRAPAEPDRAATTSGSAMLVPPPAAQAPPATPAAPAARAAVATPVPLTAPAVSAPAPQAAPQQAAPQQAAPQLAAPQQVARATAPTLSQPPVQRTEPVAAAAPAARAAVDVGRIDAVNWQWGYVVMQMEQRQGMQVGDRVYARSGDTKLWMTVRRVNGNQVSAVPDSDLQRYSVSGRVYKE